MRVYKRVVFYEGGSLREYVIALLMEGEESWVRVSFEIMGGKVSGLYVSDPQWALPIPSGYRPIKNQNAVKELSHLLPDILTQLEYQDL